jgi:hypothetical protein
MKGNRRRQFVKGAAGLMKAGIVGRASFRPADDKVATGGNMRRVVKQAAIAVVLLVVCGAIFAATKVYGVWVISGVAVVLFVLGLLRKETPRGEGGDAGEKPAKPVPEERERQDS